MKQSHMTNILLARGLIILPQLFQIVTNVCTWRLKPIIVSGSKLKHTHILGNPQKYEQRLPFLQSEKAQVD